jgi:hypothetical protein
LFVAAPTSCTASGLSQAICSFENGTATPSILLDLGAAAVRLCVRMLLSITGHGMNAHRVCVQPSRHHDQSSGSQRHRRQHLDSAAPHLARPICSVRRGMPMEALGALVIAEPLSGLSQCVRIVTSVYGMQITISVLRARTIGIAALSSSKRDQSKFCVEVPHESEA